MCPVYLAAANGHLDVVRLLVRHFNFAYVRCDMRGSPLVAAVQGRHLDVAVFLILNSDGEQVGSISGDPVQHAFNVALAHDLPVILNAIRDAGGSLAGSFRGSRFVRQKVEVWDEHWAASDGDEEEDDNEDDNDNANAYALSPTTISKHDYDVIGRRMAAAPFRGYHDMHPGFALVPAVLSGHIASVRAIITAGAHPDSMWGLPLTLAIDKGFVDIAAFLIDNGACSEPASRAYSGAGEPVV